MKDGFFKMKKLKWKLTEQAQLLKRIGELLERGYSLSEAVHSSIYYFPQEKREALEICLESLKSGHSFYDSLLELQFQKELISYVYFAENHGGLAKAFLEASHFIFKREEDVKKLKKIITYPIFLFLFTSLLCLFIYSVLLPRFQILFLSMDAQPNIFFTILIRLKQIAPVFFLFCFFLLVCFVIFYYYSFRKFPIVKQYQWLVRIPFLGGCLRLYYTYKMTIQLSFLLYAGLSIFECMQLFKQHKQQRFFAEIGEIMMKELTRGERLEQVVNGMLFFDKEFSQIINHGQANGKLDEELRYYSYYCIKQLEDCLNTLLKRLQPILYGLIGVFIVCMYLAVLLPMFHLLDSF